MAAENIPGHLTCPNCNELYKKSASKKPKYLPCNHSYCEGCLVNLVQSGKQESNYITCPDCKKTSPVPTGGVEQCPSNFFINRLLDEIALKPILEGKQEAKCGLCVREDSESAVVEVLCLDCGKFLCTYCYDNHKYSRMEYQSHEMITLDVVQSWKEGPRIKPKEASCHEHKLELKFYCETCNQLVCQYCIMKNHLNGHYHDTVKEMATKHRKELDKIMEPVEEIEAELLKININVSKVIDGIETQADEIEKQINKYYEELHRQLQQQRDELKNELHEVYTQKKKEVTLQLDQIKHTQEQLGSTKELNNAMKNGSDQEILLMEKKLVDNVKKLSDSYNKLDTQPVQLTTTEFIPVEEYKKLMPQFGCLFDGACSYASEAMDVPKWVLEDEKIKFKIITKDTNNHFCHKGGSEVIIQAQSSRGNITRVDVKDNEDGNYSASFVANQVGEVKLSVTIKGQQIKGSPFNVKVRGKYTAIDKPSKVVTKSGRMGAPWGIAFGRNGVWAVTDRSNHCVRIFDSHGKIIQTFGTNGSDKGKFNSPSGIAFDENDHLYVTDSWNNRVQKYSVTGTYLLQFGSRGSRDGQLNNPLGILVHNRQVYVVENSGNRISVFQLDGQFSHIIGSGNLKNPCYIAVNADRLLVADCGHHCISMFTLDGNYVGKFGTRGTGNGQLKNPTGIATDVYGFIFVTEEQNNRVSVFDKYNNFLHSFGSKGSGHGQFLLPRGITVSPTGDVYICDSNNERIQIF